MVKMNKFNIIGKPINVFRTTKNEYPSNMFKDRDGDGVMNAFDCKSFDPNQQGFIDAVVGAVKGMRGGSEGIKSGWKEGMARPSKRTPAGMRTPVGMKMKVAYQEVRAKALANAREKSEYNAKRAKIKAINTREAKQIVRNIPGAKTMGRGRPKGSLDKRYAAYGGVYGWRRYLSQQRKIHKEQIKQQIQQLKQGVPQYEQQQYQGQTQVNAVPQELQGQGITPEYSQAQQYQQVPQQYPSQQYQQPQQPFQYLQEQQRQIVPVFKSQGGSPYPAVDRRPLTPPQQTIPYGYVESVDSFTGKRYLKPLPRREGWTR